MPTPYAIDGPGVFVPARIAAGLQQLLQLDALRIRLRGKDREFDQVMLAWHACSLEWSVKERSMATAGTLPEYWTSGDVATRAGVTRHAVAAAARARSLTGRFVNGRWHFTPEHVADWLASRTRGHS